MIIQITQLYILDFQLKGGTIQTLSNFLLAKELLQKASINSTFIIINLLIFVMNNWLHGLLGCSNPYCPYEPMNCIVHAWNIMSLKSCYLLGFLKQGTAKKSLKTMWFSSCCPFTKLSSILKSWPILSSQQFFINFHQKPMFYFCFKHLLKKLESGTIQVDPILSF